MKTIRSKSGVVLATGLSVLFSFALAGCGGSNTATSAPATINPELEKQTQDMLKNKSQQYNERYKSKGGRPG